MDYKTSIHINFEAEKNRKALTYTLIICATLLLLFFLITWPINKIPAPLPIQDLIEVNLGNEFEGMGEDQPLIKGERAPAQEPEPQPQQASAAATDDAAKDIETDDNANEEAAAVTKIEKNNSKNYEAPKETVKKPVKTNNPAAVPTPAPPKPQKPKYAYNGPGNGKGNGADQDNGYTNQGNNPNGKGDAGSPDGKPDSYGNNPGGKSGGPKVIGNRKIVKYYSFTGDLEKATINAIVKVSPSGIGTFTGFGKGSTKTSQQYANAIKDYLRNIQFDKSSEESTVTVQFNFNVQ